MSRFYTSDEVDYIIKNYANTSTADIARHLNKKVGSVYNKAHALGLKKSAEFLASEQSGRMLKGCGFSKRTQYKKGMTPWNKGKHFSAGGNSLKTRFKKGMLPHNTMKDGDITLRTDSKTKRQYYYIRIRKARWKELHVYNWEKKNGKVPKGKVLRFIDGNTLNPEVSNLKLIDRADNMRLNTIHRFPEEVVKTIRTLGKLKRKIKQYEKQD